MQQRHIALLLCLMAGPCLLYFRTGQAALPLLIMFTSAWLHAGYTAEKWVTKTYGVKPAEISWDGTFVDPRPLAKVISFQKYKTAPPPPKPAAKQKIFVNPKSHFRSPIFTGLPHEVLGVDPDARSTVIQAAFRFWLKRFHPDRVANEKTAVRRDHKEKMQKLNAARTSLQKRAA